MKIIKWVPNALSLFRLLVSIPVLYFSVMEAWGIALALIVIWYPSDLLDGFIAHRYHVETRSGNILDLIADITLDESIVGGLVLAHQIDWRLAIPAALTAVIIRLPGFSERMVYRVLWAITLPVWGCCMLWLVGIYALKALGTHELECLLIPAVSTAFIIAWLKRERIIKEAKMFLKVFLN